MYILVALMYLKLFDVFDGMLCYWIHQCYVIDSGHDVHGSLCEGCLRPMAF